MEKWRCFLCQPPGGKKGERKTEKERPVIWRRKRGAKKPFDKIVIIFACFLHMGFFRRGPSNWTCCTNRCLCLDLKTNRYEREGICFRKGHFVRLPACISFGRQSFAALWLDGRVENGNSGCGARSLHNLIHQPGSIRSLVGCPARVHAFCAPPLPRLHQLSGLRQPTSAEIPFLKMGATSRPASSNRGPPHPVPPCRCPVGP